MPGRHVDNEAFALTSRHPFEGSGHLGVVSARNKPRPHLFDEGKEVTLHPISFNRLLIPLKVKQQRPFFRIRQGWKQLEDDLEFLVVQVVVRASRIIRICRYPPRMLKLPAVVLLPRQSLPADQGLLGRHLRWQRRGIQTGHLQFQGSCSLSID